MDNPKIVPMKTIVSFLLCSVLMWSGLAAQSEAELCHRIDSLDAACEILLLLEPGDALRQKVKQDGLKDTLSYARSLIKVAKALNISNRYQKADTLYREIDLVLPATSIVRADWLVNYCVLDIILGSGEQADSMLLAGLEMHQKLGNENSLGFMRGLFMRALFEEYYGESSNCEKTCLQAIEHWHQARLPDNPTLGFIYGQLAGAYLERGFYSKAKNTFQTGLAILAKTCKPDHPTVVLYNNAYIQFLIKADDVEEGAKLFHRQKEVLENSPNLTPLLQIKLLETEADLRNTLGQLTEALEYRRKAFAYSVANMPYSYTVYLHQNIAMELENLDLSEDAEVVLHAIADSLAVHQIQNDDHDAFLAEHLGECQQDPTKAVPYLEKALALYQELTGRKDAGNNADVVTSLSHRYMEVNRLDDAAQTLSLLDSLEYEVLDGDDRLQDYLLYRGVLSEQQNRMEEAWKYWQRWSGNERKIMLDEIWMVSELQQYESCRHLRSKNNVMLSALERQGGNELNELSYALDFELFTKSFLLSNAQKIRNNIEHGDDEGLKQMFAALTESRERLSWCYTQPKQRLTDEGIHIEALEHFADSLELELSRSNKDFGDASLRQPFSWTDVQKKLVPGEAALEIARFEYDELRRPSVPHYAIFVITPETSQPQVVFLQDGERFEQILVEKYLDQCARPKGEGQTSELYEAFWGKIEPYLQGVSRIYVSNDGAFHKINLGAIRLPGGKYVTDKYEVQPVFSLKDIHSVPQSANGERTAFLIGNPAFALADGAENATTMRSVVEMNDDTFSDPLPAVLRDLNETRGLKLDPLPGSRQEVSDLSNLLQRNGWQTTVMTGKAAEEAAVKSLRSPRLVHLATHGYFLANERSGTAGLTRGIIEKNPMLRSMLFFAGAQNTLDQKPLSGSTEDGILTAFEAQNLDLKNTELVVLSACQTAQGKVQNGEGVYGLQRALRIAGAKSLLLTLWDVDDKIGQEFMRLFYEKWLGSSSKKEAFRWAQTKVKEKHPQPFYWAGFVLME